MQVKDYTADAICRAMNLPGFIDASWAQAENPTLRILLTPSFHPELCITVSRKDNATFISVVAFTRQFWSSESPLSHPSRRERISVSGEAFERSVELFRAANAVGPSNAISLDGMGSESCLVSRSEIQQFKMHVSSGPIARFIAHLVEITWPECKGFHVSNGLAHAAGYLGIEYPLQEIPRSLPSTRIAVLGTPEMRQEYLEMLSRQKKKRLKKKL